MQGLEDHHLRFKSEISRDYMEITWHDGERGVEGQRKGCACGLTEFRHAWQQVTGSEVEGFQSKHAQFHSLYPNAHQLSKYLEMSS